MVTDEVMRHVPPVEWTRGKLSDYEARAGKLLGAVQQFSGSAPREAALRCETELLSLARSVERFTTVAGKSPHTGGHDPKARVERAFHEAHAALRTADEARLTRRRHYTEVTRSPGELLWAALLVIGDHLTRATVAVSALDPDIYERLLEGLVVKEHPVNSETLQPIA